MATSPVTRLLSRGREIVRDPLYRGSLVLLVNTGLLAIGGFAFWTLAARSYPASTVGSFSGFTSGITLVSTVAALGMPNTITRHLSRTPNPRGLVWISLATITALGGSLAVIVAAGLGPHLPPSLHLQQRGSSLLLFTGLVIATALNSAISAALVVYRATAAVLWTNLAGTAARLVALIALSSMRSSGLILAFSTGLLLSTLTTAPPLVGKLSRNAGEASVLGLLREYLAGTMGNYAATILGILPSTVVPLEVLAERGPAQTAPFAVAFLVAGFLNFIPSTASQVLFAEASRREADHGLQVRKAIRAIYVLLIPALSVLVVTAPLIMRVFGADYAAQATSALRILALAALLTGGTYLIDSVLLARDRIGAYLFMNGANAALVLGSVGVLLHRGLTGGAEGWALAQGLSLVLGLAIVATVRGERQAIRRVAATTSWDAADIADEPPLRVRIPAELRTSMPLMLGTATGAQESLRALSGRLARLPEAERPRQRLAPPGEAAFCGIWYPPAAIAVGPRQVRTARQLPVLVVISAYSGWISAELIPTRRAPDMFAGCWRGLQRLGGIPRVLVLETEALATEFEWFCQSIDIAATLPTSGAQDALRGAYAYLDQAFRPRQEGWHSLTQFSEALEHFLDGDNRRPGDAAADITASPAPAELAAADWDAMRRLPSEPAAARWRIQAKVTGRPYVRFDGNDYSVHPAAIGRQVGMIAGLRSVRVFLAGELVAQHPRSWSWGATITDPAHRRQPDTRTGNPEQEKQEWA
jgi:O-antigen/teichoic acid export membrane protein